MAEYLMGVKGKPQTQTCKADSPIEVVKSWFGRHFEITPTKNKDLAHVYVKLLNGKKESISYYTLTEKQLDKRTQLYNKIRDTIRIAGSEKNLSATYYVNINKTTKVTWGIVFGWMDDFDPEDSTYSIGTSRLCGKVAYISNNSGMTEYEIDWIMPTIDGEVYDTEIAIYEGEEGSTAESLLQDYELICRELKIRKGY